jgi:hypothetical protein
VVEVVDEMISVGVVTEMIFHGVGLALFDTDLVV